MKMGDIDIDVDQRPMIEGAFHPLVRTHPVTGRKALYVDYTYAKGIAGMTPLEANALLNFLRLHITQSAFTCRLRWRDNTLAMWDNRSCPPPSLQRPRRLPARNVPHHGAGRGAGLTC